MDFSRLCLNVLIVECTPDCSDDSSENLRVVTYGHLFSFFLVIQIWSWISMIVVWTTIRKRTCNKYHIIYLVKTQEHKVVFCYQNCSDPLWKKIVLVTEINFWNLRLKAENLQNFCDLLNNLFKQWKVRTIFGNRKPFELAPGGFSYMQSSAYAVF